MLPSQARRSRLPPNDQRTRPPLPTTTLDPLRLRLVNVYRLIKSLKNIAERKRFDQESRRESCLLMLAILFGRPLVAAALFRDLHEQRAPFDEASTSFVAALAAKATGEGAEQANWQELHAAVTRLGPGCTVGDCAREPAELARYSLVSGHQWHSWSSDGNRSGL